MILENLQTLLAHPKSKNAEHYMEIIVLLSKLWYVLDSEKHAANDGINEFL